MELLLIFAGVAVVELILCLVVRESTEQRLRRLRAELMQLRSQVRALEDKVKSHEAVRSQVREVLTRVESRTTSADETIEGIYRKLRQLYRFLRDEEMPDLETGAEKEVEERVEA